MNQHPELSLLKRFARGTLFFTSEKQVQDHLATGCISCVLAFGDLLAQPEPLDAEERQFPLGERAMKRGERRAAKVRLLFELQQGLAPHLSAELLHRNASERRALIRGRRRYQLPGLVQGLCTASQLEVFQDVVRAVELGKLAVEVAEACEPGAAFDESFLNDSRARAHAVLGNAFRVGGDLFLASRFMERALELLEVGSHDVIERADILSLAISLEKDRGQLEYAEHLAREACAAYEAYGISQDHARAQIGLAIIQHRLDLPAQACESLEAAEPLLGELQNNRLWIDLLRTKAVCLVGASRIADARAAHDRLVQMSASIQPAPVDVMRSRWLEARLLNAEGDSLSALVAFDETRQQCRDLELTYDLALATLDQAVVLLNEGRTAEVRQLAGELVPYFSSQELHRYALAALMLVYQAASTEQLTTSFLRRVSRYLESSRRNPELAFQLEG